MKIRECKIENIPEIYQLLKQLRPKQLLDEEKIENCIQVGRSQNQYYFCAIWANGEVVGF